MPPSPSQGPEAPSCPLLSQSPSPSSSPSQGSEAILSVLAAWLHDMDATKGEEVVSEGATRGTPQQEAGAGLSSGEAGGLRARFLSQIENLRRRWAEDIS